MVGIFGGAYRAAPKKVNIVPSCRTQAPAMGAANHRVGTYSLEPVSILKRHSINAFTVNTIQFCHAARHYDEGETGMLKQRAGTLLLNECA